jgi:hypothetical protein
MTTAFFIAKDTRNAEFCLLQLIMHWPVTNARQEVSFLQLLTLLREKCPEQALPNICRRVLKIMAHCIASANSSVALTACFLLLDGKFLCAFGVVRATFPLVLVPALRIARGHWHGDTGKMAGELLEMLGDDGTIESDAGKDDHRVRAVWDNIARKAEMKLVTA